jgi:hypothetical protein
MMICKTQRCILLLCFYDHHLIYGFSFLHVFDLIFLVVFLFYRYNYINKHLQDWIL